MTLITMMMKSRADGDDGKEAGSGNIVYKLFETVFSEIVFFETIFSKNVFSQTIFFKTVFSERGGWVWQYCLQAKVQRRKIASSWLRQTFK